MNKAKHKVKVQEVQQVQQECTEAQINSDLLESAIAQGFAEDKNIQKQAGKFSIKKDHKLTSEELMERARAIWNAQEL